MKALLIFVLLVWGFLAWKEKQKLSMSDPRINPEIHLAIYRAEQECLRRRPAPAYLKSCAEWNRQLASRPDIKNDLELYSNVMRHSGFSLPPTYLSDTGADEK